MRKVLLLTSVLSTLFAASSAHAFLCTRTSPKGPSVAWPVRSVELQRFGGTPDLDDATVDRALGFAAAQWSEVGCSDFTITLGPSASAPLAGFDWSKAASDPANQNIVVFRNDAPNDPVDRWLHASAALAITTVTFVSTSGEILDADVEINDEYRFTACDFGPDCTPSSDLENTLTHELGHVLGLDHPPETQFGASEATMFASAPMGDTAKRDLADDDRDGICNIYPLGEPTQECFGVEPRSPPSVRLETVSCAQNPAGPFAGLALALALTLRRRRPRRAVAQRRC